jgi:hypothetical protein
MLYSLQIHPFLYAVCYTLLFLYLYVKVIGVSLLFIKLSKLTIQLRYLLITITQLLIE